MEMSRVDFTDQTYSRLKNHLQTELPMKEMKLFIASMWLDAMAPDHGCEGQLLSSLRLEAFKG
jgi:hypothetical protein